MTNDLHKKLAQLKQAFESGILDEDTYRASLAGLGLNPPQIETNLSDHGVIAQDSELTTGDRGVAGAAAEGDIITGDDNITVYAEQGATVVIGETPVKMTAVERESALGKYLQHLISRNRYLQLQGIRSGGKLVHIELDQIYITLRATRQREIAEEEAYLSAEAGLAPGERRRLGEQRHTTETVSVSVNEALTDFERLAVLGDPGSGKTTLLRYLALLYARDVAEKSRRVKTKLGLAESGRLPILLYLRQIGRFLKTHRPNDDGTEGHALLLDFLHQSLKGDNIVLPDHFFEERLDQGRAVVLLDGLDEVADPHLRRRVSRLVEAFCRAYPRCRYVVTSRIVGYSGPARLGEAFNTTTVRDFRLKEVNRFLTNWHRLLAVGHMGAGPSAETYAAGQTRQLLESIQANDRVRDLAINPLMLTVIAMVHRDRVKLPDRRAELYAEAVDVLLGKWDEARGLAEVEILPDQTFDAGDRRLVLQNLALLMQEQEQKEIAVAELQTWLRAHFAEIVTRPRDVDPTLKRFLKVIEERTGLLTARGEGIYAFSHLTFQEYLAALAVAGRDDYIPYTLKRTANPWWREVILLEAGYLSTQSREKTTRFIRAIAGLKEEPEPYHNLVLAAECLRDVGSKRVKGNLEQGIKEQLQRKLGESPSLLRKVFGAKQMTTQRIAAAQALARIGGETFSFWSKPYGEPEWVEIPAGEFWMGSEKGKYDDERPQHKLHLDTFLMARTPITNAQYHLFVQAANHQTPRHWEDERPPKGLESHPVVNVSWHDAMAYCRWLGEATGKNIILPSEAEWEKAARGDKDKREYPWGDTFEATRCNSSDLGLGQTTPVGIFPNGAGPYGCLDMSGNVWEWTRSLWEKEGDESEFTYPYNPTDGRENLDASDEVRRVLRGGAFHYNEQLVRCAVRHWNTPDLRLRNFGFRVLVSPFFS